ncbi:hypothetical protein GMD78_03100 [Ornithinibacillus sp. L9]|uniref:Esterase n=1 Tax=Ornithinibacillus caprae TaxID=2678566 RepID=A0A6N8FJ73_9BACI|nr:alpha/beta hydrolase-fold protein [Ornithinibacillus caprae]MUK87388.1 hypothetical protein [Ornithinibacillus caprae]
MEKRYFHSTILNKAFEYHVVAPDHPITEGNILYVQDGNDYLELGKFLEAFHGLKSKGLVPNDNWIIVFIHPGTSEERWHSYNRKGSYFHSYIQMMHTEFIPFVEKELSVRNVIKRGLLGDSLAANISLNIAAKQPSMWTHLLLQSAAISQQDLDEIYNMDQPLHWKVYQTVGIYEDEFVSPITNERLYIYTRNRELAEVFRKKGASVQLTEFEEHHLWVVWERDLPNALKFLFHS